jgi:hypothetical protein
MPRPFRGTIDLDIRKSKPDWDAFLDAKAPKDAPNVLVILYDDTGQAAQHVHLADIPEQVSGLDEVVARIQIAVVLVRPGALRRRDRRDGAGDRMQGGGGDTRPGVPRGRAGVALRDVRSKHPFLAGG